MVQYNKLLPTDATKRKNLLKSLKCSDKSKLLEVAKRIEEFLPEEPQYNDKGEAILTRARDINCVTGKYQWKNHVLKKMGKNGLRVGKFVCKRISKERDGRKFFVYGKDLVPDPEEYHSDDYTMVTLTPEDKGKFLVTDLLDESKMVVIKGLPPNVTTSDLRNYFEAYGIIRDFGHAEDSNLTFVTFATEVGAIKAVELNGNKFKDVPIEISLATGKSKAVQSDLVGRTWMRNTIKVYGLDTGLGRGEIEQMLWDMFTPCGPIKSITFPESDDKGYAYIKFEDSNPLFAALQLHGTILGGRKLKVRETTPAGLD